jgi:tRNA(fMet)-specific endonuclease VapC
VILLDTNIVIHFNKRSNGRLEKMMLQAIDRQASKIFLPAMVYHELKLGAHRHRDDALGHIKLATFKSRIGGVLALTEEDAALSADIRHELQTNGQMIGAYDVLIAAQALARDALLVTHNSREFSRVAGLRWVDWMAE